MRHQFLILLISLLLINCNNESKQDAESENSFPDKVNLDSLSSNKNILQEKTIDSINDDGDLAKKTEQNEKIIPKTQYLKDFLLEPINLNEFKNKYGPSNSGGCCSVNPTKWLYKPEEEGFYYQYMLFWKLKGMRDLNGKLLSEGALFREFQIYVYHFGKNQEFDFYNDDEVLIGFSCAGMHEALDRANIIGKSLQEIEELFGNEYIDCDSIKIYQHNNRVLSLKLKSSKIEWIKYFHQSSIVEKGKIPEHLIIFN